MSATQAIGVPNYAASISNARLWTGRIISGLAVLFLLFDSISKILKEPYVIKASAEFGLSAGQIVAIGAILLACTVVYVIPRTAVLGALLLTGYLGGAVEANFAIGHPVFECIFPIIFGVLVWVGVFLRDERLVTLLPFRKYSA